MSLLLHGIPLYEYTTIFSPTSLLMYIVSCFYSGGIMNKAAMNSAAMQESLSRHMPLFLISKYLELELLDLMVDAYLHY